jgi:hypothetical protein
MVEFNKKITSISGNIDFELIEVFLIKNLEKIDKIFLRNIFCIRNAR